MQLLRILNNWYHQDRLLTWVTEDVKDHLRGDVKVALQLYVAEITSSIGNLPYKRASIALGSDLRKDVYLEGYLGGRRCTQQLTDAL